jgi:hypothetical protein
MAKVRVRLPDMDGVSLEIAPEIPVLGFDGELVGQVTGMESVGGHLYADLEVWGLWNVEAVGMHGILKHLLVEAKPHDG